MNNHSIKGTTLEISGHTFIPKIFYCLNIEPKSVNKSLLSLYLCSLYKLAIVY